jgi:hypothetical protein
VGSVAPLGHLTSLVLAGNTLAEGVLDLSPAPALQRLVVKGCPLMKVAGLECLSKLASES